MFSIVPILAILQYKPNRTEVFDEVARTFFENVPQSKMGDVDMDQPRFIYLHKTYTSSACSCVHATGVS